ncbi:HIT family protein [Streptomyces sp. Ru71]|uniref:HIT family protein n=1 Tax=Streptomyces sp. Ru71 TaxID=2080746 RepID=UPI000CDDBBF1|nr:HIT family protein [Streptomyces sp. Ru71]POX57055.1 HIT family protein [Streptomyces sp. Ru71]
MAADTGDCVFCAIAAHRDPARIVHEDAHTVAFFPLAPAVPGHTLVVPRAHAADLWEMDEVAVGRVMRTVLRVGSALRAVLAPQGLNIIHSSGTAATQTVFHAHVHVVPRHAGDAMGPIWPPRREGDAATLDDLAGRLTEALASP